MSLPEEINKSANFIRDRGMPSTLEAAVILGSGLGDFAHQIDDQTVMPYEEIPGFPASTVKGHAGELIFGKVNGYDIVAFSGRFHHYEGFSFEQTHIPIYIAKALDAQKLIISNAAGAVNRSFVPGDLVIIESVLRQNLAISARGHKRFRYNHHQTVQQVEALLKKHHYQLKKGNYLYAKGPNYETKAEIRAFRKMGADMVGMSTAPELFEAARLKIKTAAISLITNMAAGIEEGKLNHEEVKKAAQSKKEEFAEIVQLLIEKL